MKCEICKKEQGTVLQTIVARNPKDNIEIKYTAGHVKVDDRLLCWFCATPNVGSHLGKE